jgi:hypothetical protein
MPFRRHINVRAHTDLTGPEITVLIEEGREFFELLEISDKAKGFLEFRPRFREVLEKW